MSVRGIVCGHFSTLRNYGTGRVRPLDILAFTLAPLALVLTFSLRGKELSPQAASSLIIAGGALALMAAMLLNLVARTIPWTDLRAVSSLERRFAVEVIDNLSYTMLAGTMLCALATATLLAQGALWKSILDAGALLAGCQCLLAFLMSLRRTHVLLKSACQIEGSR